MHGMVNRGLQSYVRTIFSFELWEDVCTQAGLSFFNFETMLTYDDEVTDRIIDAIAQQLSRSREEILEDFGTFVVAEKDHSAVRRLLRFGGEDYVEFLFSLEDVHDLASVVLPELDVPRFELTAHDETSYTLDYRFEKVGFGAVFLGLLRAMADDYGALVLIDHHPQSGQNADRDRFDIQVLHLGWPDQAMDDHAGLELVQ